MRATDAAMVATLLQVSKGGEGMTTQFPTTTRVQQVLVQMAWERVGPAAPLQAHLTAMGRILADEYLYSELHRRARETPKPKVVCLCGSTRFWREYQQANARETLLGNIVLSVGFFVHTPADDANGVMQTVSIAEKRRLDELHLRKIDMADEVLFLNVGGYMGDSTRAELEYARGLGKIVRFLEPED
jgi:hypothetical protein